MDLPKLMTVMVEKIEELRLKTGVSRPECLHALKQCDGDVEKAVDKLKKRGNLVAIKTRNK